MSLRLRPAQPADAPRIAEVLLASRRAFLPYAPSPHTDAETHAWVEHVLVPAGGVVVAEQEGRVDGVLAWSASGGASWIDQLYVHPDAVGRGLGARLLEHALGALAAPIRLKTFQANAGARRFYERHGFVAVALGDGSDNEERCPDVTYERE